MWCSGATPQFGLLRAHINIGYCVEFILRALMGIFNVKANRLSEYAKGSMTMNHFKVADQGAGLHCIVNKSDPSTVFEPGDLLFVSAAI